MKTLLENNAAIGQPQGIEESGLGGETQGAQAAAREYRTALFNNLHDAVFIHDLNGRVVDVNEKMLQMYGLTRREAIGLSIVGDYSSQDDPQLLAYQSVLWKRVMSGESQLFEYKARRPKSGTIFDVEVSLTKLSLPEGDFILATTRDISERKRVERELLATKNYLNTVFNNIHDAIFIHDVSGKVVDVNDKLLDMYRFTREEAIGLSIIPDYAVLDDRIDQPACWKKALAGENQIFECKGRRPKDGYMFDAEIFLTKLSLPDGDFILANVRDITARKRAEEQLHAEKQKFQTLSESSPIGMVVIDGENDFKFEYTNPKFKELFGYGAGDVPDKNEWFERAYPDAVIRRRADAKWTSVLRTMKPGIGKHHIGKVSGKDGAEKHVRFIPVQLETGEVLMTCWDITKYQEADKKVRERNLVLEVLNDVMASVGSSLRLSEILETLKKIFVTKLKINGGGVFLYSDVNSRITMETYWGVPESARDDFEAFALKCHGNGRAAHGDDAALVKNELASLDPKSLAPFKKYRWRRYLCISLLVKEETHGVIFLVDKRPDSFGDDQIAFFNTLGQQIGVAMQNARLFEQVRQSHAQMKALSLRLVEVQEAERRYIARELHDEIGQELTGLKLALEMSALQREPGVAKGLIEARSVVNSLVGLVREMSLNLRPAMLDDLGLLPTLLWHFGRFTNQTSIQVSFKHKGIDGSRFPLHLETAIYRIVQEALTNVARHAKVSEVIVRLWSDSRIIGAQIEDSGVGFNTESALATGRTNGLDGMRERALLLGGHFTIESHPGTGTRLTAEMPIGLLDQRS